ncbi:tRNA (guanosine(46)-N7)-methyltransferase TrmB [Spiroplasma endosymbiont of Aspidapion aeneum]|uniref:tRNA (guanosine(46)-N7)-methyltransferase TrmB n=1 Tax=Spiroplasma endosymbiont of Aspidapion aeneum TaxID=3066276 RepID=UPI00313ECCE4
MRIRKKKWTKKWWEGNNSLLLENSSIINDIILIKNKRLNLEIGCGKGDFIINKSVNEKDNIFIGLEKDPTILAVAMRKFKEKINPVNNNLYFSNILAQNISEYFPKEKFKKIFLNFSDPWPKKHQAKRRLTHISFLKIYYNLLVNGGTIEFKTDNDNLFLFTIEQVKLFENFLITYKTSDLYSDTFEIVNNVQTEYETKFLEKNVKIKKMVLQKL